MPVQKTLLRPLQLETWFIGNHSIVEDPNGKLSVTLPVKDHTLILKNVDSQSTKFEIHHTNASGRGGTSQMYALAPNDAVDIVIVPLEEGKIVIGTRPELVVINIVVP